jgi:8-oxo-dGTP pyrophosphatase MutT (NUDIX family)
LQRPKEGRRNQDQAVIVAAGILFMAKDGRVLLVRRSAEGDHAGEWAIPGGKVEQGETPAEAAIREAHEEIGIDPAVVGDADALRFWSRRQANGVDWTTYLVPVREPFATTLNGEHDAAEWVFPCDAPEPLHPGAAVVLARIDMDELGVAQAIRDGHLTSPQRFENIALVAMRITGTGMAYREGLKEHVWRDPELYLNEHFLARCNGLPVIVEHPKGRVLDSQEFADRVVGTIMLPYVKQNEVWGIAKIYDESTIKMIEAHRLSTSPAVVFRDPSQNTTQQTEDGETLLIEGNPSLLDHLAICEQGVWDKGGTPTGVATTATDGEQPVPDMPDQTPAPNADPTAKADQHDADVGGKLDQLLARLDGMASRLDALDPQGGGGGDPDPTPPMADAAAGGDAGEEFPPEIASMPRETAADRVRYDSACAGWKSMQKAKADAAAQEEAGLKEAREAAMRADSAVKALREELDSIKRAAAPIPEDEARALADEQVRADSVYAAHGATASRPVQGETLQAYRRRLAAGLQKHSPAWKGIDLGTLPPPALEIATAAIYADAAQAARNPVDVPEGTLREVVSIDSTGRRITSFVGEPRAWMDQFGASRRRVTGISNGSR